MFAGTCWVVVVVVVGVSEICDDGKRLRGQGWLFVYLKVEYGEYASQD